MKKILHTSIKKKNVHYTSKFVKHSIELAMTPLKLRTVFHIATSVIPFKSFRTFLTQITHYNQLRQTLHFKNKYSLRKEIISKKMTLSITKYRRIFMDTEVLNLTPV